MDILGQYNKENPALKQSEPEAYLDPLQDYGSIIRLVMRISGGRIQDVRRASTVLLITAIIIFITAASLFILNIRQDGTPPPPYDKTYMPMQ